MKCSLSGVKLGLLAVANNYYYSSSAVSIAAGCHAHAYTSAKLYIFNPSQPVCV
jgi:hypothetical protein